MPPKFGTSGLRGLVAEMKPELIRAYVQGFLRACDVGETLYLGRDLRPSSPQIATEVSRAARSAGVTVVDAGPLPTPALALAASQAGASAVMVTGSHIPADRNGLKFYSRQGEITKADETAILAELAGESERKNSDKAGGLETDSEAGARYVARYVQAFGPDALSGQLIGLYAHSAVGRDLLEEVLVSLGAKVVMLGRSEDFIPVDTEAVDGQTRALVAGWVVEHGLDALVSTDGDSDRPLLIDETGMIVPGDIMGQITAECLGAEVVVTPVSSNSGVMQKGFATVSRTCIGSPFVIAGMAAAAGERVVGYEANGGFLLGFDAVGPAGAIAPLITRDCTLPLVTVLQAVGTGGLAARVAKEPPVITRADRLQDIAREKSLALIGRLSGDASARSDFLGALGQRGQSVDQTDGLRMMLEGGGVLHLRPSGNAPELRVYVEGSDAARAQGLLENALGCLAQHVG